MKWGDVMLRLLIRQRDRDTISGDLLEEYREHILPARGPIRARLWYVRQLVSFVTPVTWGLLIGAGLGVLQLASTAIAPLADDDARVMLMGVGIVLLLWTLASIAAGRPSRRFFTSLAAGALVGIATLAVFDVTSILRINLFLDEIRRRDDWVNLMARFDASGFTSLRAYANWEYLSGTPVVLGIGAVAGAICGTVAGIVNLLGRTGCGSRSTQIRSS